MPHAYALCLMSHVLCLKKHSMLHLSRVRTPCPANLCLCLCLMPYALKTLHDSPESRANTVPCQRSCKVSLFALPCMSSGLAAVCTDKHTHRSHTVHTETARGTPAESHCNCRRPSPQAPCNCQQHTLAIFRRQAPKAPRSTQVLRPIQHHSLALYLTTQHTQKRAGMRTSNASCTYIINGLSCVHLYTYMYMCHTT
jgi:hypothetical protein